MNRSHWTPESPHNALRLALASASLLSLAAAPSVALASEPISDGAAPSTSGVYVTILSPNPGTSLAGAKKVEISAYYESSFGVASLDLFIDGKRMATQKLASAETKGEISFVVDPAALRSGAHTIVVRATALDAEVASARTSLTLPVSGYLSASGSYKSALQSQSASGAAAPTANAVGAPSISILDPNTESSVAGIVRIKVNASDPSGQSPYVSLFVDHAFKTLRNFPPYTFDWDTTRVSNGYHTIEVWGYNDSQQVGHASPIRVMVNNPGGRTFVRQDLSDTPSVAATRPAPSVSKSAAKPVKRTGLPKIAHSVKKAIAGMISRADKLASIKTSPSELESGSVDRALIAPLFTNRMPVKPSMSVSPAHHSGTTSYGVAQPAMANPSNGAWQAHPLSYRSMKTDEVATSGLADLGAGNIPLSLIAPGVPAKVTAAPSHSVSKSMPGRPVVAGNHLSLTDTSSRPLAQMASADVEQHNLIVGQNQTIAPKIDISRIEAEAQSSVPAISRRGVTLSGLSPRQMHRIAGSYQVVVDDQRVELNQPLQDRGSVLFAPLRQIFESQGGQLDWDHTTQQVRAVTPDREVVLKIGSKQATVNNQSVRMTGAPYLYNNRTMLPLDFFPMAMNVKVSFDATSGHLLIESR